MAFNVKNNVLGNDTIHDILVHICIKIVSFFDFYGNSIEYVCGIQS